MCISLLCILCNRSTTSRRYRLLHVRCNGLIYYTLCLLSLQPMAIDRLGLSLPDRRHRLFGYTMMTIQAARIPTRIVLSQHLRTRIDRQWTSSLRNTFPLPGGNVALHGPLSILARRCPRCEYGDDRCNVLRRRVKPLATRSVYDVAFT